MHNLLAGASAGSVAREHRESVALPTQAKTELEWATRPKPSGSGGAGTDMIIGFGGRVAHPLGFSFDTTTHEGAPPFCGFQRVGTTKLYERGRFFSLTAIVPGS